MGFAAGVNIALVECQGRDVLLLNPDVRVSPELPRVLAAVLDEDRRIAAVAPRLIYQNGAAQRVVWPVPSPREAWIDALKLRRAFPPRRVFLIGAVLLLRAEALVDVGRFDERFFLYAERCDGSFVRFDAVGDFGSQRMSWPVHAGGGSSEVEDVREHYSRESAELFAKKWYGRRGWAGMRSRLAVRDDASIGA